MRNEVLLDNEEVTFPRIPIPADIPEDPNEVGDSCYHCVVLCKRVGSNIFYVQSGAAFIGADKNFITPGARVVSCLTKTTFIFE